MIGAFKAELSSLGIFWVVEIASREVRLLTAGCSLEVAEPYGDFLIFPDGHYEVWGRWRNIKHPNAALRALVRAFEYEDWSRGRIVFDRVKERFVLYADRKLMLPDTISSDSGAVRPFAGQDDSRDRLSLSEPGDARASALRELWNRQLHQCPVRFDHSERVALTVGEQLDPQIRQLLGNDDSSGGDLKECAGCREAVSQRRQDHHSRSPDIERVRPI